MKTKTLLFSILLAASSLSAFSAELLVSEDFSSAAWKAELLLQNPGDPNAVPAVSPYAQPTSNASFTSISSVPLYFGKYYLNGAMIICDGKTTGNMTDACQSFATTGIVHSDGQVAVGFRFRSGTTAPVTSTYMEFPELASASNVTVHVRNGNTTATTTLTLQKYDSGTWTTVKEWTLAKGNDYQSTSLDEIKTFNVNSTDPIKLRLCGGTKFIMMFRVDIEASYKIGLRDAITASTAIQTANASNIGTETGQYPQEAYDAFGVAIAAANTTFNKTSAIESEVTDALNALNAATITFQNSENSVPTALKLNTGTNTQVFGINGGIRISGLDVFSQVSIYGITGALVKQVFTSSDNTIALPKGSYFVKIQANNSTKTIKAIVR